MAAKKEKPKNRTVYYFRCEFAKIDGVKVQNTLEVMANIAWKKLNSTQERTFYIGEERSVVGMKLSSRKAKLRHGDKDCTLFCGYRKPRVYPWMNAFVGGTMAKCNITPPPTVSITRNIT